MKPPALGNHRAGRCSVAKAEIESPSIAGTYIIGLFDILGQTHKLRDLPSFLAPPGTPARAEATSTLSEVTREVADLRWLFRQQFKAFGPSVAQMAATCGLEGNEIALLEPSFRQWGMSDSYVVAIPPPHRDDERVSRLADVYRLLSAAACTWLHAMRVNLPIRGGIELGLAVAIEENEVYGRPLAEAHLLESTVAQYPRIVVGPELVTLLNSACRIETQDAGYSALARLFAQASLALIQRDEDERLVVDVTSTVVVEHLREAMPDDLLPTVMRNVEQQLKCHDEAGCKKLVERYQWLQRRLAGIGDRYGH